MYLTISISQEVLTNILGRYTVKETVPAVTRTLVALMDRYHHAPPSFGIDECFESQVADAGEPVLVYREVRCKT